MINYSIIDKSIKYYESKGFQRIESPWTVTAAISNITKPSNAKNWTIQEKNKVLVASGEQSFLYLYNKGFLPKGKFQTVTPCFRDDVFDEIHTKYFIKNELIITGKKDMYNGAILDLACDAKIFFERILKDKCRIIKFDKNNYDVYYRDIELGSYGFRECGFLKWIFGTGVAEPRLTRVIKKYGISCKQN